MPSLNQIWNQKLLLKGITESLHSILIISFVAQLSLNLFVLIFILLFVLARLFAGGYTGCMSSQHPFIPPMRGGKNNSMTHERGSGESVSGSITTLGSGGKGFNEEDEKRQAADDVVR